MRTTSENRIRSSISPAARLFARSRPSIKNQASGSRPYFEITLARSIALGTAAQSIGSHFPVIPGQAQEQFRHQSVGMTLRYLKTLSHLESMNIEKSLDIWR